MAVGAVAPLGACCRPATLSTHTPLLPRSGKAATCMQRHVKASPEVDRQQQEEGHACHHPGQHLGVQGAPAPDVIPQVMLPHHLHPQTNRCLPLYPPLMTRPGTEGHASSG